LDADIGEEIEEPRIESCLCWGRASLTVGGLVDLKQGDIPPCDFDGNTPLVAEGIPVARGAMVLPADNSGQGQTTVMRAKSPVLSNVVIGGI